MIVFGLCLIMACALFVRDAEATKFISYKSLGRYKCGIYNRGDCKEEHPSNGYDRGCSQEDRCRDGKKNGDDDDKDKHKDED
ncbi:hypothetical protein LWI28_019054 [Acer negundo]|uniref:Uncharacterized protein n=1 Tax=Acer negundo TaxID=4023 RepID=A0AAD5IUT9_ACENE|nr:hypothetical protein LWI28_019054 [Acer negundo]